MCPQRHTPTQCPPTSCDRRMITTFGFFCCNKTQLNSVGICDTIDKMRRRLLGFQLEPSRWVGSDDYGYVASTDLHFAYYLVLTPIVTFAKQYIGFCRFLGWPASPRSCLKRYWADRTLPSTFRLTLFFPSGSMHPCAKYSVSLDKALRPHARNRQPT